MNTKLKVLYKILNFKDILWFMLFLIPLIIIIKEHISFINFLILTTASAIMLKISDSLFPLFLKYNNNPKEIEPIVPFELAILSTSFLISSITLSSFVGLTTLVASAFLLIINQVRRKKYDKDCICIPISNSLLPSIVYIMFLGLLPSYPAKFLIIVILLILNNYLKYIQINVKFESNDDYLRYKKVANIMYYLLIIMFVYLYKTIALTSIFFIIISLPFFIISIFQFTKKEKIFFDMRTKEIIFNLNNIFIVLSMINEVK